jgi:flagellar hook-basal body complex protein FliE
VIAAIGAVAGTGSAGPIAPIAATTGTTPTSGAGSFASGLNQVQGLLDTTDSLASQLATGKLQDIGQYTAAAAQSSLAVQFTAALRDKAIAAYNSIMTMQV